jgi:hypothetical protein
MPCIAAAESEMGEGFWESIVNRRCGVLGQVVAGRNMVLKTADLPSWLLARTLLNQKRRFDNMQRSISHGERQCSLYLASLHSG